MVQQGGYNAKGKRKPRKNYKGGAMWGQPTSSPGMLGFPGQHATTNDSSTGSAQMSGHETGSAGMWGFPGQRATTNDSSTGSAQMSGRPTTKKGVVAQAGNFFGNIGNKVGSLFKREPKTSIGGSRRMSKGGCWFSNKKSHKRKANRSTRRR